jgi:hypothetical protein
MTTVHLGLTTVPGKTCQEPPNLDTAVVVLPAVHQAHFTLRVGKAGGLVALVQLPGLQRLRQRVSHRLRIRAHPTLASKKTISSDYHSVLHPKPPPKPLLKHRL